MKTGKAQIGVLLTVLVLLLAAALPLSAATKTLPYSIDNVFHEFAWTNPEGIYDNGGLVATFDAYFDFFGVIGCDVDSSLPDGAVITGVTLTADVWTDAPYADVSVELFTHNGSLGENRSFWLYAMVTDTETRSSAAAPQDFVDWLNQPGIVTPWQICVQVVCDYFGEVHVDYVALRLTYTVPGEGSGPTIVVIPLGDGDTFLDRTLPLEPGEDPPVIGGEHLCAIYTIGEPITGDCMLTDANGDPIRNGYLYAELYQLDVEATRISQERVVRSQVRYSRSLECYHFEIATDDLSPGYYDVRLFFPDGTSERMRIELVEPPPPPPPGNDSPPPVR